MASDFQYKSNNTTGGNKKNILAGSALIAALIIGASYSYFSTIPSQTQPLQSKPLSISDDATLERVTVVPRSDLKTPDGSAAYNILETEGEGFHRAMITHLSNQEGRTGRVMMFVQPLSSLRGQLRLEYSELTDDKSTQLSYGRADIVLGNDNIQKEGAIGNVKVDALTDNWYLVSAEFPVGKGLPTLSIDLEANQSGVLYKGEAGKGITVGTPTWSNL